MGNSTKRADSICVLLKPRLVQLHDNKSRIIECLKTFAECSVCGSILVYLIGTAILLLRNLVSGAPFVPLSITQAVVITVYFCVFVGAYIIFEHILCSMQNKIRKFTRFWQRFWHTLILLVAGAAMVLISVLVLWLFFRSVILPLLLVGSLFVLVPFVIRSCYRFFKTPKGCTQAVLGFIMLMAGIVIWNMPMSVGGLGPQRVTYYDNSGFCREYGYYGVANGMLVFKSTDGFLQIPIDNGHIEYAIPEYSFFGSTTSQQDECGNDSTSFVPTVE